MGSGVVTNDRSVLLKLLGLTEVAQITIPVLQAERRMEWHISQAGFDLHFLYLPCLLLWSRLPSFAVVVRDMNV